MRLSMSSSTKTVSSSSSEEDAERLRRGPWTLEEDSLLVHYISRHGEGRWNLLAKRAGLRRTGKSCRLRWLNYLKPDVKRGNLTPQEQLLILDLHSKWGNRWSKIAQHLPGRTDNEIKNYWRTRVQKQAKHLKVDANSSTFQEIIRCFWMPRLIQKIENSSPSIPPQNQPISHVSPPFPPPPPPPLPHEISDHNNSNSNSSISSTESINMTQITEYPNSVFHAIGNNSNYNGYYAESDCYNTETMGVPTMCSLPGEFQSPAHDRHVPENDWVGYDFAENMWSMDEFMSI